MAQVTAQCGVKLTAILVVRLLFLNVFAKLPIKTEHFIVYLYSRLDLATAITLYEFLDP